MWYNAGDVSHDIIHRYYHQKRHRPIILVGHSLGANEQIKVARNLNAAGVPVALLVTVDAVSQTIVPPNVKQVLNVYKPGYVPMFSGLKLRAQNPKATSINNLNVAQLKEVHVNHFTIDKDEALQAMILDSVGKVLINGNEAQG
jgi:alpha/beta superfamily hydrolase